MSQLSDQLGTWTLRELRFLVDELAVAAGRVQPCMLARARMMGAEAAFAEAEANMDEAMSEYARLLELENAARAKADPGAAVLRKQVSAAAAKWARLKVKADDRRATRDRREAEWRALL